MSGRALSAVESYVEARNAANVDSLIALFGEDAVIRHGGAAAHGPAGLRPFVEELLRNETCPVTIARLISDGNVAMVELWRADLASSEERRHAVEVLVVDADGLIQELNIYRWDAQGEAQ